MFHKPFFSKTKTNDLHQAILLKNFSKGVPHQLYSETLLIFQDYLNNINDFIFTEIPF